MRKLIASVCFIPLAAGVSAFELPAYNAAALRAAQAPVLAAPVVGRAEGWHELRSEFFRAAVPGSLEELGGIYRGHLHPLYEREDYTVPFVMVIYRDDATGAMKAVFPMPPYGAAEIATLKLTQHGAELADAWGGRARLVIRRDGRTLRLFSNLYSDETYGACVPAEELPPPGRGLEDDMPHGAIPGAAHGAAAAAQQHAALADAFKNAAAPSAADLQGWRAGRFYDSVSPAYPGGALLAGWKPQAAAGFRLVVMTVPGNPSFFEKLDQSLAGGIKVFLEDEQSRWTAPVFGAKGVTFERLPQPYDKGYYRFEARKAADGRLLLKKSWRTSMGGSDTSGTDYYALTADVTPR